MRAVTFTDELRSACAALLNAPLRYGLLAGLEQTGLRRRPYKNYVIIYASELDTVTIVRVLSSAQDLQQALN